MGSLSNVARMLLTLYENNHNFEGEADRKTHEGESIGAKNVENFI